MWYRYAEFMRCHHKRPLCFCYLYSAVLISQSSAPRWIHRESQAFSEHTQYIENATVSLSHKI